ncbi:MAG: type II toxin-antitoxin system HicA family toxin [Candidatus Rokubacteria bacterium]|nr:type II toxin-antitoxin system HicA family toxin [Candidatus Rokubacteria bacterium]
MKLPAVSKARFVRTLPRLGFILEHQKGSHQKWRHPDGRFVYVFLHPREDIRPTVSLPYLLDLIKRRYPQFRVTVGVFAGVDHVQKARTWEELGADCITLESLSVNRRFPLLTSLRKTVRCDLMLLVDTNCLQSCPFSRAHMVALSHASQVGHPSRGVQRGPLRREPARSRPGVGLSSRARAVPVLQAGPLVEPPNLPEALDG